MKDRDIPKEVHHEEPGEEGATRAGTGFVFKKVLDIGAVLTSVSILVSMSALWVSWHRENRLRTQEYADRIRHSTAVVTAKVERWSELSDRYFEDIGPTIVDVSEKMAATHTRQPANRMMYKGLLKAGADASERIVKEQLQVAYMELYGYVPELQTVFDNTITSIKEAEASSHKELSKALQEQLPNLELQRLSDTVSIGNLLRKTVDLARLELRTKIRKIAAPLRAKMLALIQQPDDVLADIERRAKFTKELATRKDEPGVLP